MTVNNKSIDIYFQFNNKLRGGTIFEFFLNVRVYTCTYMYRITDIWWMSHLNAKSVATTAMTLCPPENFNLAVLI